MHNLSEHLICGFSGGSWGQTILLTLPERSFDRQPSPNPGTM